MSPDIVVLEHSSQNYHSYFDRKTGFYARVEKNGHTEPFWAENGPELLDISITNWCDKECSICYRNSNQKGKFVSFADYEKILLQAIKIPVLQVALGGGNTNQHPYFTQILEITRNKYGIVPSYTTNGRGLTKEILRASKEYCGAVAVSAYYPYKDMIAALSLLKEYGMRTNIHYILHKESVEGAIEWLKDMPNFLDNVNAIIFLNYKPIGQFASSDMLLNKSNKLADFFKIISENKFPFKIGFDSCSISGIVTYMDINPIYCEACEAGRFSAYISEDMQMYPCSFLTNVLKGIDLRNNEIANVWRDSQSFSNIREKLNNSVCPNCPSISMCLGGCPFIKDINLCAQHKYM